MQEPLWKGLAVFYDSATYFALSILIASVYSLAKKDFGISARGFGALEAQITWAVDVVCILPLLYPIALLPREHKLETTSYLDPSDYERTQRHQNLREKFRFVLLGLIVTVFTYPFVSQAIHNWAPSQIGEGNGEGGKTIISYAEYHNLTMTCFGGAEPLTIAEDRVLSAFVMIGSIVIFLFTIWSLTRILTRNRTLWEFPLGKRLTEKVDGLNIRSRKVTLYVWRLVRVVMLLGPIGLAIPLLWGILRLRRLQSDLANVTSSAYADNEWTFGQVVSIIIFAPVLFEMLYCWFEY